MAFLFPHTHSKLPITQYSSCSQQRDCEVSAAESVTPWCLASSMSNSATPKIYVYLVWVVRVTLEPGPGRWLHAITVVLLSTVLQVCTQHSQHSKATTNAELHTCSAVKHLMHAAFIMAALLIVRVSQWCALCRPDDMSDQLCDTHKHICLCKTMPSSPHTELPEIDSNRTT